MTAGAARELQACLAVSDSNLLEYSQMLADPEAYPAFSLEATYFLLALSLEQCAHGIRGALGEIGSTIGKDGKNAEMLSFQALSLLRRPEEKLLLVGPFLGEDEDGFAFPNANFDAKGKACIGGRPHRLQHLASAPVGLTDTDLLKYSDSAGFRLLRIDRTIGANETHSLLHAARCALNPGGLLVFEGSVGMSQRPGAQEGFHRFMLDEGFRSPGERFVPFLWAGKQGGLVLAAEAYADMYREAIKRMTPKGSLLLNDIPGHDTKFLYGSRILAFWWRDDPSPDHVASLLEAKRAWVPARL
eukprot:TRINITY_DN35465_c0_g1_i1.p1 TRINITY_DN35465_c0_g1~~TRINITY_DN35465_c0_g1_i1.p1  ORF type:complete len:331 (+),score=44.86 TRINITY_DN35465_c0_g1_i1:91-993(+)